MFPLAAMAAIGAASKIAGGVIASKAAKKSADKARSQAGYQFAEQMDNTIYRRVQDAKRAGVHPLFALGSSAGASPTATISGQSDTGSFLGEGIASAGRDISKLMDPIQLAQVNAFNSESEKNFAQAAYFRSEAKRAEAEANSGPVRTYAATEPTPFRGTPIDTPMGTFTPERPNMAENLEQHYGGAMDALGLFQFLKEWFGRPTPPGRVAAGRKQRERTRAFINRFHTPIRGY